MRRLQRYDYSVVMRAGVAIGGVAALVVAARLCHSHVLWADDNLPLAAAIQIVRGKTLYRDIWFDKPPLVAWIDLLWGAHAGVALRLAGAAYVIVAALAARMFDRAGVLAFAFTGFFLTFGIPSAVVPLASDMLLVLPHFLAMYFAMRGRPFWSGAAAGVGLLCSSKAMFVLLACALWQWRALPLLLAGFAAPNAIAIGWMWLHGSAAEFYRQAWQWGSIYAANTFVENPIAEGVRRTGDWIGFQAALAIGAGIAVWKERDWRMGAWIGIAMVGVVLGFRFFPRYYFLLLPPTIVAASRGWTLVQNRRVAMAALVVLLAIPAIRFGPRYVTVARGDAWRDLDIDRDSQAAAATLKELARPGDSLFVWGFRPDIFVYSGMPAGARFLESQPISGVLADRHLFSSEALAPDFIAPNRAELLGTQPQWIVDGLGLYNPGLAIAHQPYLANWFAGYREVARTQFSIVYRMDSSLR